MDEKKTLSPSAAIALFDRLADMEDVAHGYPLNGCAARTHFMCLSILNSGLKPGKAWAFEGKEMLCVRMPGWQEPVLWGYHVAPTLPVLQGDGTVVDMVFDPGLFDGPVPLGDWGEIMGASPQKLQIVPHDRPPRGWDGNYSPATSVDYRTLLRASEDMALYRPLQKQPRDVFKSALRRLTAAVDSSIPACGRTWRPVDDSWAPPPLPENAAKQKSALSAYKSHVGGPA